MTPSPSATITRNLATVYATLRRTEAEAMRHMEAAQAWAERTHPTEHAREQAYRRLCRAEQTAIDATNDVRTFLRRHPDFGGSK